MTEHSSLRVRVSERRSLATLGAAALLATWTSGSAAAVVYSNDNVDVKVDGAPPPASIAVLGYTPAGSICRDGRCILSQQDPRNVELCLSSSALPGYSEWRTARRAKNPRCDRRNPGIIEEECAVTVVRGKAEASGFRWEAGKAQRRRHTVAAGSTGVDQALAAVRRQACASSHTIVIVENIDERARGVVVDYRVGHLLDENGQRVAQPGIASSCGHSAYRDALRSRCAADGRIIAFQLPNPTDTTTRNAPPDGQVGGIEGRDRFFELRVSADGHELVERAAAPPRPRKTASERATGEAAGARCRCSALAPTRSGIPGLPLAMLLVSGLAGRRRRRLGE